MSVNELSQDQLDELKTAVFYGDGDGLTEAQRLIIGQYLFAGDIPNAFIKYLFSGYSFTCDDFGCTAGKY